MVSRVRNGTGTLKYPLRIAFCVIPPISYEGDHLVGICVANSVITLITRNDPPRFPFSVELVCSFYLVLRHMCDSQCMQL